LTFESGCHLAEIPEAAFWYCSSLKPICILEQFDC
jgi:hypothetical protein